MTYDGYHYFSYPTFGQPEEDVLYCGDCDHEEPVTITLDLTLTIVKAADSDDQGTDTEPPAPPR